MNALRKSLVIGMTVFSLGAASLAAHADETTPHQRPTPEQMAAKMAEHFQARQAKLHDALKLSPQQEGAWTTYQAAIRPQAPANRPDRAAFKAMSAPERMQAMIGLQKQRIAAQEARLPAVTAFYGQLTPEQKQTFDKLAMHHGRGPGFMGHRG
jgi:hypothetical protein